MSIEHRLEGRSQQLTIFLAKEGTREAELLAPGKRPTKTPIHAQGHLVGNLYTVPSISHDPSWIKFFNGSIDSAALKLKSSGAAALLICKVKGRLFAVTFGYGRHLLEVAATDDNFGLKVTLNASDEDGMRSIDRRNFDGISSHVREQTAKATSLAGFSLDVERDLLRAVVGTPEEKRLGPRMTGMDSLTAISRTGLEGLKKLLEEFLEQSLSDAYRTRYPWIDNISEVRDPKLVDSLWEQVCAELSERKFDRKWLSIPDLIDWQDVKGFKYRGANKEELSDDVHLSGYLSSYPHSAGVSLEALKRHKIRAISSQTDQVIQGWPVHRCMYAEIDKDDCMYLVNDGKWYAVDTDFVKKVNSAVSAIPESSLQFLPAKAKEAEGPYNRRLAKHLGGCLMDQKTIAHGGGASKIEFCDVMTSDRKLVHVKRYSGSSTLSHLFAQGTVSATTFASDSEFRVALNKRLPEGYRLSSPHRRPIARHYEIAYAIISKSRNPLQLPFFSRIALKNSLKALQALNYTVTLTKIATTEAV